MITPTHDIKILQREIVLLRSFLIGVAGKDREGLYRPEFVRKILDALDDTPEYHFRNTQSFLKEIES